MREVVKKKNVYCTVWLTVSVDPTPLTVSCECFWCVQKKAFLGPKTLAQALLSGSKCSHLHREAFIYVLAEFVR